MLRIGEPYVGGGATGLRGVNKHASQWCLEAIVFVRLLDPPHTPRTPLYLFYVVHGSFLWPHPPYPQTHFLWRKVAQSVACHQVRKSYHLLLPRKFTLPENSSVCVCAAVLTTGPLCDIRGDQLTLVLPVPIDKYKGTTPVSSAY
uniref:Uncharacterized protein n=1 Tax=Mesocestoides corti TaxID=53468 RepID=A0A5K3FPL5_MESCO